MLFGIIIVIVAVVVAYLLNKNKVTGIIHQVEDKLEPMIQEVEEVTKKAVEVAPKNEVLKQADAVVTEVKKATKPKKDGPKKPRAKKVK